jgi:hypothetical protein
MKETSQSIASDAARLLRVKSYPPIVHRVAASCLSQYENGDNALIDHVREFIEEADKGGVSVGKWAEVFKGDLEN